MDVREKLVELLNKANSACVGTDCFEGCKFYMENDCLYKLMADVMIANDATVQEWISVKDRLPITRKMIDGEQYYKTVAVRIAGSEVEAIAYYDQDEKRWIDTDDFPILEKVTHWYELPEWDLPQPPKGE